MTIRRPPSPERVREPRDWNRTLSGLVCLGYFLYAIFIYKAWFSELIELAIYCGIFGGLIWFPKGYWGDEDGTPGCLTRLVAWVLLLMPLYIGPLTNLLTS